MLETDKAVEVAAKLPPPFLADVAVELDPRRASDLIAKIAPALIGQVTGELVARREYVTMGRFVGHLGDDGSPPPWAQWTTRRCSRSRGRARRSEARTAVCAGAGD
jgi:hypothetical protein